MTTETSKSHLQLNGWAIVRTKYAGRFHLILPGMKTAAAGGDLRYIKRVIEQHFNGAAAKAQPAKKSGTRNAIIAASQELAAAIHREKAA